MKQLLNNIKIDLQQEFDRNFERKAFFYQRWKPSKNQLIQTGALRRSIKATLQGQSIVFSSALPYANLHNQGGTIKVTAKMKRFFWAMYYKTKNTSYKAFAVMPIGKKIKIPQRQFIGNHPEVRLSIQKQVSNHLQQLAKNIHP